MAAGFSIFQIHGGMSMLLACRCRFFSSAETTQAIFLNNPERGADAPARSTSSSNYYRFVDLFALGCAVPGFLLEGGRICRMPTFVNGMNGARDSNPLYWIDCVASVKAAAGLWRIVTNHRALLGKWDWERLVD